jgi:hypothetical protein
MSKTKPIHEIRLGRIRAAIWANESENGTRYNVTVSRLYKDDDGWKDSSSFGRDDLPLLMKVADLAHLWIFGQNGERPAEQAEPEAEETTTQAVAASHSPRRRR